MSGFDSTVTGNSVTVNNGTVMNNIYGGHVIAGVGSSVNSDSATTNGNSVFINDGTVSVICGGEAASASGSATAKDILQDSQWLRYSETAGTVSVLFGTPLQGDFHIVPSTSGTASTPHHWLLSDTALR